jgi:hypothetical protein
MNIIIKEMPIIFKPFLMCLCCGFPYAKMMQKDEDNHHFKQIL